MNSTKLHTVSAAALLFIVAAPVRELSFHPEDESRLGKEFEVTLAVELDELSVMVDGNDVSEMVPLGEFAVETSLQALISDEYREVADGRPIELVRVFEEIAVEYDTGDEQGSENVDELEGVGVLFSWNEELEAYDVAFTEDSAGTDEEVLQVLLEDMDLRGLLPDGDADEGDTWEVPADGILGVLLPGLRLADLGSLADEGDGIPDGILEQVESLPEGFAMQCEFAGQRDVDGVTVGVINVILEGDGDLDLSSVLSEQIELPDGIEPEFDEASLSLSLEGEGELLWSLDAGHLVSYSMESDLEIELLVSASIDAQGETHEIEADVLVVGEIEWSAGLRGE